MLTELIDEILTEILADESIPQELRNILSAVMQSGLTGFELTDEHIELFKTTLHALPDRLIQEGLITQAQLDEFTVYIEQAKLMLESVNF